MAQYSLLARPDGDQWTSLCVELDIASDGATAEEALATLETAVREALEFQQDTGISAGVRVPERDLAPFRRGAGSLDSVRWRPVRI